MNRETRDRSRSHDGSRDGTAALSTLCAAYWYPVYSFARSQGCDREDARDITQGFFAALLERNDFASVDADQGRLRSWLRTAARRYLFDQLDRARAKKRGGGQADVDLDVEARGRLPLEANGAPSAEQIFDRCWARSVVERALTRLRAEYQGESDHVLIEQILSDDERPADTETAAELGISPQALRTRRARMKDRLKTSYGQCLRMEIAQTVESPAAIEDELRELLEAL